MKQTKVNKDTEKKNLSDSSESARNRMLARHGIIKKDYSAQQARERMQKRKQNQSK